MNSPREFRVRVHTRHEFLREFPREFLREFLREFPREFPTRVLRIRFPA
ncbi:hypothetical protein [Streptomyces sp. NPDC059894]